QLHDAAHLAYTRRNFEFQRGRRAHDHSRGIRQHALAANPLGASGSIGERCLRAMQGRAFNGEQTDGGMMFDIITTCRNLLIAATLLFGLSALATAARAQQVVVIVNGEPITALDIEQRSKLNQLSTHKTPTRQEVLDELINEKLKVREAKKLGFEIPS